MSDLRKTLMAQSRVPTVGFTHPDRLQLTFCSYRACPDFSEPPPRIGDRTGLDSSAVAFVAGLRQNGRVAAEGGVFFF